MELFMELRMVEQFCKSGYTCYIIQINWLLQYNISVTVPPFLKVWGGLNNKDKTWKYFMQNKYTHM